MPNTNIRADDDFLGFGVDEAGLADLLQKVDGARLMATTAQIARRERLSGSPGEMEAFVWVKKQLDSAGFKTKLLRHYAYISLPRFASLHIGEGERVDCIAHAFTGSTSDDGVTAPVVHVGDLDQATSDAIAGKIALVFGRASGMGTLRLEELGAVGQIYVHGDKMHETAVSPQWGSPTDLVEGRYPRTPGVAIREPDGLRLREYIESGEGAVARIETRVDTAWTQTPLLTADLEGPEREFVLLSCHIDSWHLGAMDNGSANATVMEVGRILAEARDKLRRGLRLAFWSGHSHGKYSGSAWYADNNWHELRDYCVIHVNCDSTGGIGAIDMTMPPTMPETHAVAKHSIDMVTGVQLVGKRVGRFGDQSFLGIGVPSLYASLSGQPSVQTDKSKQESSVGGRSSTLGWWWHTPEDTIDKVDESNLVRDTKVYLATVYRFVNSELLPVDYRKAIGDAKEILSSYAAVAPAELGLNTTLVMLENLEREVEEFYSRLPNGDHKDANQVIQKLGRRLIPFRYHEASQFDHDWGGELMPIPSLRDVRRLAHLDPASPEYLGIFTRLRRRLNAVEHSLLTAERLLREAV